MKVVKSGKFSRAVKRLHPNEKALLDEEVRRVIADTLVGKMKTGDLAGYRVHKFKLGNQERLLAYIEAQDALILAAYGPHENFYRDLKQ